MKGTEAYKKKIVLYPTHEEIALDSDKHIANLDGEYEKLTLAVTRYREEWHRAIDKIIKIMKTEITEIKVKIETFYRNI